MGIVRVPVKIESTKTGGGPYMNVFHVRTVSNDVDLDVDLGNGLDALEAFYEEIKHLYSSLTQIRIGESMIIDPGGSPTYANDQPRTVTGTGSGDGLSPLLAVCVSWRTSSATRAGRGRTFVGPLIETVNDADGTPISFAITDITTAAANLVSASTGANGWAIGVYSPTQQLLRDITGHTVADRFAYLSSRRD
jgi:hypothetical protein